MYRKWSHDIDKVRKKCVLHTVIGQFCPANVAWHIEYPNETNESLADVLHSRIICSIEKFNLMNSNASCTRTISWWQSLIKYLVKLLSHNSLHLRLGVLCWSLQYQQNTIYLFLLLACLRCSFFFAALPRRPVTPSLLKLVFCRYLSCQFRTSKVCVYQNIDSCVFVLLLSCALRPLKPVCPVLGRE